MSGKRPTVDLDNLFGGSSNRSDSGDRDGGGGSGRGGGQGSGGSGGSDRSPRRLEEFAAAAQSKYLFDNVPLLLKHEDGTVSHAFEKRGSWTSDSSERLEPFEAVAVRDIFIKKYGDEARALREMPARPDRSRELYKDIDYNGNKYHIRVKYFSSTNSYYETTIYRRDK